MPQVYFIQVGYKGVDITWTCYTGVTKVVFMDLNISVRQKSLIWLKLNWSNQDKPRQIVFLRHIANHPNMVWHKTFD